MLFSNLLYCFLEGLQTNHVYENVNCYIAPLVWNKPHYFSDENPVYLVLTSFDLLVKSPDVTQNKVNPSLASTQMPGLLAHSCELLVDFRYCFMWLLTNCPHRRFSVINPSNTSYSFSWTNEDMLDGTPEGVNFRCLTPEGTVLSGKKYEMAFEYVSDSLDLVESFWRFFVPEYNISIPFVMVGHTFEPALSFDRSHINFREMLLGRVISVLAFEIKAPGPGCSKAD